MDPLPRTHGPATLRRLRPADLAAFQACRGDPDVARYQDWAPMEGAEARAFLAAMQDAPPMPRGWWQIGVTRTGGDTLSGDMGLCLSQDGRQAELGITLAREAQGAGLATAAMRAAAPLVWEETEARRILVITDARNAAALRMIRRLDLAQTDTLHEAGYPEPVFTWPRPP